MRTPRRAHDQRRDESDENEDECEIDDDGVFSQSDVSPTLHAPSSPARLLDHEDGESNAETHQQREHGRYASNLFPARTGIDAANRHLRVALLGDGDVADEVADGVADSENSESHDEGLDAHHGAERVHEENELVGDGLNPHDRHE